MNRVSSDTTFEDFLDEADLDAEMRHGRERLVEDVANEDKFVRFLPAYGPDAAYRKFVRNQAKTRIYGWLEVPQRDGGYSENYFVVQMKGDAMSPDIAHNSWAIFRASVSPKEAVDKIVICHHHSIDDSNFGKRAVTIRRFSFEKFTPEGSLFDRLVVTLSANSENYTPYALEGLSSDSGIEIAGVMEALVDIPSQH